MAYYAKAGDYYVTKPVLERLGGHRWAYYDEEALAQFQRSPAANMPGGEGFRYDKHFCELNFKGQWVAAIFILLTNKEPELWLLVYSEWR